MTSSKNDETHKGRKRSRKAHKERQDASTTLAEDVPDIVGRAGGNIKREVATRDHQKRAFERPAGTTRVQGRPKAKDG